MGGVQNFLFVLAPPSSPIRNRFGVILTSAIFFYNHMMPLQISAIKFVPNKYARLLELFIRFRTPFIPYTEGFRSDYDIDNFFLQTKDAP